MLTTKGRVIKKPYILMSDILDRVTEYDLWCYYLQQDISFGKRIKKLKSGSSNNSYDNVTISLISRDLSSFLEISEDAVWSCWETSVFEHP
jgi:hypothetical protein